MANRFAKYAQPEVVNPNPMFPGQLQGQGLNNQGQALQNREREATLPFAAPKAAADAQRSQVDAQVSAATAPAEIAGKAANATKSGVDAQAAQNNFAVTGGADNGQAKSASFYSRALRSNGLYELTGVKDEPFGHQIAKTLLPDSLVNKYTSTARQKAEAAQKDFIAATLRYESGANLPPSEFETQRQIFFPQPGDAPETVQMKAQLRKNAIDGLRIASGAAAPMLEQGVAQTSIADIGKPTFRDEFDPETSAAVDRLIRMGRPVQEIGAFAASKGYQPSPEMLSSIAQAELYAKQHRDYKGGFTQATRPVPMSLRQKVAGSPLGAFGAAAGNAATLGMSDEIAGGLSALQGGDYSQGRDAFNANKQLLADAHPIADFAGSAVGSIAPLAGAGLLAGGGARATTLADLGVGGAFGAGESNDNRLGGAVLGAGAAGAGNLLGRGAAKSLGSLISPTGGKMAPLYELGVRPSIGQRVGGVVNSAEERLQSIPVLGDAIAGTRDRARDQFQIGLFNDALGEIGQQLPKGTKPGHAPHAFAQKAFNRAYDAAKSSMTAAADSGLATDLGGLQRTVATLRPDSQSVFEKVWSDAVARRFRDGSLSGPAFKDATSEIEKKIAAIRNSKSGDGELADALQQASDALRASAVRNSPPEAVAALDAADRGYAKLVRLEEASRKAGDPAEFSPNQYNTAVKTASGGVRNRSYLAGDALNTELAAAGTQLGDKVANSRSIDRLLPALAATGGAHYVMPNTTTAVLGALAALNAPGIRNLTTSLMAPRGKKARTLADLIRKQSGIAGAIGSGVGIGLLPPQ